MKKNMMMMALVAGLLGTSATAIAADNAQPLPCPPPGVTGPSNACGYGMMPNARRARPDMKRALGLSDSQDAKVREMSQNFFNQSKPVFTSIKDLKRALAVESVRRTPDQKKIEGLTRSIGQEHSRLSEIESRHIHDLSTVLDERQIDRFLQMKDAPHGRKRG